MRVSIGVAHRINCCSACERSRGRITKPYLGLSTFSADAKDPFLLHCGSLVIFRLKTTLQQRYVACSGAATLRSVSTASVRDHFLTGLFDRCCWRRTCIISRYSCTLWGIHSSTLPAPAWDLQSRILRHGRLCRSMSLTSNRREDGMLHGAGGPDGNQAAQRMFGGCQWQPPCATGTPACHDISLHENRSRACSDRGYHVF